MTKEQMRTDLINLAAEILEVPEAAITDEADFFKDLRGDSLQAMQFVTEMELKYGVTFSETDAKRIRSIQTALDVLSGYLQLQAR